MLKIILWCASSLLVFAGEGVLVHLTPASKMFRSEVVVTNYARNDGWVEFMVDDRPVDRIEMKGQDTRVMLSADLGQGSETHFSFITSDPLITVHTRFIRTDGLSPISVPASIQSGNVFRFDHPARDFLWEGLAVVNLSRAPATIRLRQLNSLHEIVLETTLVEQLGHDQKYLSLLSSQEWVGGAGGYEILSDRSVHLLLLTGSWGEPAVVSQMNPVAVFRDRVTARVWGGFASIEEDVVIDNGRLSFKGITVDLPDMNGVLQRWVDDEFMLLEIDPVADPCCDMRFYSATLSVGDQRNGFHFSDVDVAPNHTEGLQAFDFVERVFNLAIERTGAESMVFPGD